MAADGDFLSSSRNNCRAARANLVMMFPKKVGLSGVAKFAATFTKTCGRHNGQVMAGTPKVFLDTDGMVPKLMLAALFGGTDGQMAALVGFVNMLSGDYALLCVDRSGWAQHLAEADSGSVIPLPGEPLVEPHLPCD